MHEQKYPDQRISTGLPAAGEPEDLGLYRFPRPGDRGGRLRADAVRPAPGAVAASALLAYLVVRRRTNRAGTLDYAYVLFGKKGGGALAVLYGLLCLLVVTGDLLRFQTFVSVALSPDMSPDRPGGGAGAVRIFCRFLRLPGDCPGGSVAAVVLCCC